MKRDRPVYTSSISINFWCVFYFFALLQSVVALLLEIVRLTTIGWNIPLGISITQLVIFLVLICASSLFAWLLFLTLSKSDRMVQRHHTLMNWLFQPVIWARIVLFFALIFLGGCFYCSLLPDSSDPLIFAVLFRFLPIVLWVTGLSAQTLVFLLYTRYGLNIKNLLPRGKAFYIILVVIGLIFLG